MAKILNLYCGLGGNRKLWGGVEHEITAVEIDEKIANEYKKLFPNDTVIVGDAHKYLVEHLEDGWDFIWTSPPCPSHSRINTDGRQVPRYPEMELYQQIILLGNNWYKGKFVVENVIPYYDPLIPPTVQIGRHFFWSNFRVNKIQTTPEKPIKLQKGDTRYGFDLSNISTGKNRKVLRNLVDPEIGLHFLNTALEIKSKENIKQTTLEI